MHNMVVSIIIMILTVVGYAAALYFGVPYFFAPDIVPWVFFIIYTAFNFAALALSWLYFDRTNCYQDEANPLAKIGHYLVGHDLSHVLVLALRIFLNVTFYFLVFGIDIPSIGLTLPPQSGFVLSVMPAIFMTEFTFNVYANMAHGDEKCEVKQPVLCIAGVNCEEA